MDLATARLLTGLCRPGDEVLGSAEGWFWTPLDPWTELAMRVQERESRLKCSGHRFGYEHEFGDLFEDDPGLGNSTAGAGFIPQTRFLQIALRGTVNAAEIRTLNDPPVAFLELGLSMTAQNAANNIVVRCQTPIWIGTTVTQPALTNLGQYITFSATGQTCQLRSVPVDTISRVGTKSTFKNATGFRWTVIQADGPTVT